MPELDLQALSDQTPLHRKLGLHVSRTDDGLAFQATVGTEFVADTARGTVHGGIIATLLDTAATFALIAATEHDWVTVDLRVDYLRPVLVGTVVTTGEVLRAGRTVGRARATLTDESGTACAVAIGTFAPAGDIDKGSGKTPAS